MRPSYMALIDRLTTQDLSTETAQPPHTVLPQVMIRLTCNLTGVAAGIDPRTRHQTLQAQPLLEKVEQASTVDWEWPGIWKNQKSVQCIGYGLTRTSGGHSSTRSSVLGVDTNSRCRGGVDRRHQIACVEFVVAIVGHRVIAARQPLLVACLTSRGHPRGRRIGRRGCARSYGLASCKKEHPWIDRRPRVGRLQ